MKRAVIAIGAVIGLARVAAAEPHKILVLQSEGRADAKVRAKLDAAVVKLAKTSPDAITAGEITYADAAAMVGCKPDEASCKDEVIGTLGVDEIVVVAVTPKPGGLEVAVRRFAKGAPPREATTLVTAEQIDKLDAIAPLFGGKAPVTAGPPLPPTTPPTTTPAITTPPTTTEPPTTTPETPVLDQLPVVKEEPPKSVVVEHHEDGHPNRRLPIIGMAGSGVLLFIGLVYWGKEGVVQGQINDAPTRTKMDLVNLKSLESEGDRDATLRTVFVLGGLALGGVSTYYYIKARRGGRSTPSTAAVTPKGRDTTGLWLGPTLFDHGAGITLTVGGSP